MRHLVLNYILRKELKEKFRSSLRGYTVKFFFHILIPFTGFAQENPWVHQPTGENPWAQQTTVSSSEKVEELIYASEPETQVFSEENKSHAKTTEVSTTTTSKKESNGNLYSWVSGISGGAVTLLYLFLTKF